MFVIQFNGTMRSLWRHSWVQDYPEAHFVLITSLSPSTHANLTHLLWLVVFSVLFIISTYIYCRWIARSISQVFVYICITFWGGLFSSSLFIWRRSAGNVAKLKQVRKRLIIQQPSKGGRECPKILEEQRECELPKTCPGFRWSFHPAMLELEINGIVQDFRKHANSRREIVEELQELPDMITCKVKTGVLTPGGNVGKFIELQKNEC